MKYEDLVAPLPAPEPCVPLSYTEYEAIPALNWSTLKHLAISPRMLRWRADHPRPETAALRLGRAIHCAILEPERWARCYVPHPDFGDGRTKAAKAAKADWLASIDGRDVEVLDADEHALAEHCAEAVRTHPRARRLLEHTRVEETVTWTDEETGVDCKSRLDIAAPGYVVDLKSSRMQTVRAIEIQIASLLYHGQLAFYHDAAIATRRIPYDADGPYIVVVQTVEPYDVVPGRLMREDLEKGRALYRSFLRKYLECQAADWWPGLAPDVIDLDLPPWTPRGEAPMEEW